MPLITEATLNDFLSLQATEYFSVQNHNTLVPGTLSGDMRAMAKENSSLQPVYELIMPKIWQ